MDIAQFIHADQAISLQHLTYLLTLYHATKFKTYSKVSTLGWIQATLLSNI